MAYIKIFDENAKPIGVVNISDFQQIANGERYVKTSNENVMPNGMTNIDGELSTSDNRLITVYNEQMIPIAVIELGDFYYNSVIGDLDDNQGGDDMIGKKGGDK